MNKIVIDNNCSLDFNDLLETQFNLIGIGSFQNQLSLIELIQKWNVNCMSMRCSILGF